LSMAEEPDVITAINALSIEYIGRIYAREHSCLIKVRPPPSLSLDIYQVPSSINAFCASV
jgi:hypothetical protein